MGFFYAALWLVAGIIIIKSFAKENKIFYLAGAFFFVLAVWWALASIFPETDFFSGTPGTVLQIISFAALVILSVVFFIERQRNIKKDVEEKKKAAKATKDIIDPDFDLDDEDESGKS